MSTPEQDVRATIGAWLAAVERVDFATAATLWDAEYDGLLYQPEEIEQPMTRYRELLEYWAWVPGHVEAVPAWRATAVEIQMFDGVALAWTNLDTSIKLRDVEKTFDGVVRCTFGLRETAAGWKFVHYHESRLVGSVEDITAMLTA